MKINWIYSSLLVTTLLLTSCSYLGKESGKGPNREQEQEQQGQNQQQTSSTETANKDKSTASAQNPLEQQSAQQTKAEQNKAEQGQSRPEALQVAKRGADQLAAKSSAHTKHKLMKVQTMEYSAPGFIPPNPPMSFDTDRENYAHISENGVYRVTETPVSTFSIDVDTGSYSNMRRMINNGQFPPADAIRVEELINYFTYLYPVPTDNKQPFSVNTEMAPAPWNKERQLLRIGLKGYQLDKSQIKAANLVFLLDVSGSMNSENKLPLLIKSLKMLTGQLNENDRISIVVYAGASGVVLENAAGNEHAKIAMALEKLSAGGSTHGSAGIKLAYQLAQQYFIAGGVNRVILATDGDFNVGTVNTETLKALIARKRESGIGLTTLGFGRGNYNDQLMEQLADVGNGNYAYIDTLNEARKVLVDEISSTLQTIAKDVKIQVEFNPELVAEYRLIGYENRVLNREDFNNDKIDAGEIGAGHAVTALYELTMVDSKAQRIGPLRYQDTALAKTKNKVKNNNKSNELAYLRLRYKAPQGKSSQLIEQPITLAKTKKSLTDASDDFRFVAAVAGFGQLLKGGHFIDNYAYNEIIELGSGAKGDDLFGYRSEFLQLVRTTEALFDKPLSKR